MSKLTLGIMQPYFFPYLAHFALVAAVDEWIVFDVTQYTPKTWLNRNRILHPTSGWQYVTVPLANSSIRIRIHEARVLNMQRARAGVLGKLSHYRRKAPYFESVAALVDEAFGPCDDDSLVHLNVRALGAVCRYLGIAWRYRICSELNIGLSQGLAGGQWALEICTALGATRYVNPTSGRDLFDPGAFAARGIALTFAEPREFVYRPGAYDYVPHLSILDALMWSPADVLANAVRQQSEAIRSQPA